MKIVVTGGSGFIGKHIIRRLVADGHDVTGLSHGAVSPSRRVAEAQYIGGVDIADPDSLSNDYFSGADAVVHLVGIIAERKPKQTFTRIHVTGTANVVAAAKQMGVKKIVYMSAIGSRSNAAAEYSRTKAAAEGIIKESGIGYVILRPSIVLGRDGEFVGQMKDLVNHGGLPINLPFPFIPIPGNGKNKFQPIYVDDLAECVVRCIADPAIADRVIEVGGAEQVSFDEIVGAFAACEQADKPLMHVPIPLLSLAAPLVGLLPKPPFTGDQLKNLRLNNTADITEMRRVFRIEPIGFSEIMKKIYGTGQTV